MCVKRPQDRTRKRGNGQMATCQKLQSQRAPRYEKVRSHVCRIPTAPIIPKYGQSKSDSKWRLGKLSTLSRFKRSTKKRQHQDNIFPKYKSSRELFPLNAAEVTGLASGHRSRKTRRNEFADRHGDTSILLYWGGFATSSVQRQISKPRENKNSESLTERSAHTNFKCSNVAKCTSTKLKPLH
jgi:hypothetical protein